MVYKNMSFVWLTYSLQTAILWSVETLLREHVEDFDNAKYGAHRQLADGWNRLPVGSRHIPGATNDGGEVTTSLRNVRTPVRMRTVAPGRARRL